MQSGAVRIIDWANSSIGHPFFSFLKLLRKDHRSALECSENDPVVQAYLQAFCTVETESRLLKALNLVIQLQHAWRLLRWSQQVPFHEASSPAMARLRRLVPGVARELMMAHRG
jgi:hypothetical protein